MLRRVRHRVLLPFLLVYLAALIFSAIPPGVHPGLLDAPYRASLRLLNLAGIEPGLVLFHDPEGRDAKRRAVCVVVRGHDREGGSAILYPPDRECVTSGVRWRMPPVHLAIANMLELARAYQAMAVGGAHPERYRLRVESVLASLATHFCRAADPPPFGVSLLWYIPYRSYATGREWATPYLVFGWDCTRSAPNAEAWFPDDDTLARLWGPAPWQ